MSDNAITEISQQEIIPIARWAKTVHVSSQQEYNAVIARIAEATAVKKRWRDYWKPIKNNAHVAWKSIVAKEGEGIEILDGAMLVAKTKAEEWRKEEHRKAMELQRKLQAEAEEQARRERERLEREAEKLKTPKKKEAKLEQAEAVIVPIVNVAKPEIADGTYTRTNWRGVVVSLNDLIKSAAEGSDLAKSFLMPNQRAIDDFARAAKGRVAINGIKFEAEESLTIRGAK